MPGGVPELHGLGWLLGGPVGWYLAILYVLAFLLAAYTAVDSLRRRRATRLAELPEPSWLYAGVGGVYIASVLITFVRGLSPVFGAITAGLIPLAIGFGAAYLLRVVFPKPAAVVESGAGEVEEELGAQSYIESRGDDDGAEARADFGDGHAN